MIYQFATIITKDHLDKALTLLDSLRQGNAEAVMHILLVDGKPTDVTLCDFRDDVRIYLFCDLLRDKRAGPAAAQIIARHGQGLKIHGHDQPLPPVIDNGIKTVKAQVGVRLHYHDALRWAAKSAFAMLLLQKHDMLFLTDCDLHFYSNYDFIAEALEGKPMLLSPHWRTIYHGDDSTPTPDEFKYNYLHGLYNAGFIGLTKSAMPILDWWAGMCAWACTDNPQHGMFVDQRYLDVVPVYFENVEILRHKGCNVAAWNCSYLPRKMLRGKLSVAGDPLIFIHYSGVTIYYIERGYDLQLRGPYAEYCVALDRTRDVLRQHGLGKLSSVRNPLVI